MGRQPGVFVMKWRKNAKKMVKKKNRKKIVKEGKKYTPLGVQIYRAVKIWRTGTP